MTSFDYNCVSLNGVWQVCQVLINTAGGIRGW